MSERIARRRFVSSAGALSALGLSATWTEPALAQELCRQGADDPGRPLANDVTGADRMHLPAVALPARPRLGRSFDLVVRIGEPLHEQRHDHHIAWIEALYGAERLFACDLSPDVPFPVVRVPVVLRRVDVLRVRLRCSRDGVFVWQLPLEPR
ncbi:MAG: hypothetical protein K1X94_01795 [Sandaracinaceae bacterium]|nr:hypothetical protein [Sandaracinaceae bacterium]